MSDKPSIVFCHGIWADGSCFNKLIPPLHAEGYEVVACQYGVDSLQGDVDAVLRTLGRVSSPSILVGHSYGGSVITAAGTDDRVIGLVYMAALAPDETETSQSQQDEFPRTDIWGEVDVADGRAWMLPSGAQYFAGDLSEEERYTVWATHYPPDANLFNTTAPGVAWRTKPSAYMVCTQDHTVNPELQRFAAQRMGAKTYEIASSHVPMLSHPDVALDVIRELATAVQNTPART